MVRYGCGHGTVRGTVLAEAWYVKARGHGTVQGGVMVQYRAGPWYNLGQGHGTVRGPRFPRLSELQGDEKQVDSAWSAVSLLPPKPWPEQPEQVRDSAGREDWIQVEVMVQYSTGYRAWVMAPWSRVTRSSAVLSVPSERGSSCKRSYGCTTSAAVWNPSVLFEAEPYLGCSARGNG